MTIYIYSGFNKPPIEYMLFILLLLLFVYFFIYFFAARTLLKSMHVHCLYSIGKLNEGRRFVALCGKKRLTHP